MDLKDIPVPYDVMPIVLPAHTKSVIGIQDGPNLVIYVEAYVRIGSRLTVQPLKERNFGPLFRVLEIFHDWGGPSHPVDLIVQVKEAFEFKDMKAEKFVAITAAGEEGVDVVVAQQTVSAPLAPLKESDPGWQAIHDFMPLGEFYLTVFGTVYTPTPGWKLKLETYIPVDHGKPDVLYLRLVRTPPTGVVNDIVTPNPVRFREATPKHYAFVSIDDGGNFTEVKVKEVH